MNWVAQARTFAIGLGGAMLTTLPTQAAEKIVVIFGPLNLSIRVESLEEFAKDGVINKNLTLYMGRTTPEQQAEFRKALTTKAEVDPLVLSRFFNTDIGEDLLQRIGRLINIQGGSNGKFALRGALIKASMSSDGLTLLNFLQNLPTNMQIDISRVLNLAYVVDTIVLATNEFTRIISELSAAEAKQSTVNFANLPDLRQPGEYGVQPKKVWVLTDQSRERTFYVDVYLPQKWRPGQTPVVIASHGLASRPEDYASFAEHLASYGYVVAMPQHPGSDYLQARALLEGFSRQVFLLNEFIDRPKDMSFVIDELERRNQSEFGGRLNLKSVGVAGHSFGGYAALALAGARIDYDFLEAECNRLYYPNTSLLLQCRALKLPRKDYDFRDERVGAVLAVNPVNSSIFGKSGLAQIQIPVFIGAGTYDPATPAIFEQVRSFPWFTTPERYLFLIEGQAHVDFSQLDAGVTSTINSIDDLTLPSPYLIREYAHAMETAFFGTYIAQEQKYRTYLQAAYSSYLSQGQEFKSFLITAASSPMLEQALIDFRNKHLSPQYLTIDGAVEGTAR